MVEARDTPLAVDDGQLIERSLCDGPSFAEVFDRHYRVVFRFLRGQVEVAPFPLTRWGYAAAASAGVCWVMFSYSIGLW
jgi:hypothetical protein